MKYVFNFVMAVFLLMDMITRVVIYNKAKDQLPGPTKNAIIMVGVLELLVFAYACFMLYGEYTLSKIRLN